MGLQPTLTFGASTDVGRKRSHNEDNFLVDRGLGLFVVADGMGGHSAGEVASGLAVRLLRAELEASRAVLTAFAARRPSPVVLHELRRILEGAVQAACVRIHTEAQRVPGRSGMGTTLSALLVVGSTAVVAHVGDSRIYLYRGGQVRQLTEDHTVYNELRRRGDLSQAELDRTPQKNAITRAVGVYPRVQVDTDFLELAAGDRLLLVSDGMHGYVGHEQELAPHLDELDPGAAARSLVALANQRGGKDNITAVVIRVEGGASERALLHAVPLGVLRRARLFAHLDDSEVRRVVDACELVELAAGNTLFQEGSDATEAYVVVGGTIEVRTEEGEPERRTVGDHVGESALVRRETRAHAARAMDDSLLLALPRGRLVGLVRSYPELGAKLLWRVACSLAERLADAPPRAVAVPIVSPPPPPHEASVPAPAPRAPLVPRVPEPRPSAPFGGAPPASRSSADLDLPPSSRPTARPPPPSSRAAPAPIPLVTPRDPAARDSPPPVPDVGATSPVVPRLRRPERRSTPKPGG
jgi:serine/threonine protein phosphatase PrpC